MLWLRPFVGQRRPPGFFLFLFFFFIFLCFSLRCAGSAPLSASVGWSETKTMRKTKIPSFVEQKKSKPGF
jgi:hypothetical protein